MKITFTVRKIGLKLVTGSNPELFNLIFVHFRGFYEVKMFWGMYLHTKLSIKGKKFKKLEIISCPQIYTVLGYVRLG